MKSAGPFNLRLVEVIYDEQLQTQRIRKVLREGLLAVDAELGEKPDEDVDLLTDVVVILEQLLLDEIVRFKHPAFVDEREWRLVARFDPRGKTATTRPSHEPLHRFRSSGGYMVPYIALKPAKGKLPLASIRFGPSLDFNRYESPMRLFLAQNDFSDVEVSGAGLPVIL